MFKKRDVILFSCMDNKVWPIAVLWTILNLRRIPFLVTGKGGIVRLLSEEGIERIRNGLESLTFSKAVIVGHSDCLHYIDLELEGEAEYNAQIADIQKFVKHAREIDSKINITVIWVDKRKKIRIPKEINI